MNDKMTKLKERLISIEDAQDSIQNVYEKIHEFGSRWSIFTWIMFYGLLMAIIVWIWRFFGIEVNESESAMAALASVLPGLLIIHKPLAWIICKIISFILQLIYNSTEKKIEKLESEQEGQ